MQDDGRHPIVLPFPPDYRASGVLALVTSLPSGHSIGDLGPVARQWQRKLASWRLTRLRKIIPLHQTIPSAMRVPPAIWPNE